MHSVPTDGADLTFALDTLEVSPSAEDTIPQVPSPPADFVGENTTLVHTGIEIIKE